MPIIFALANTVPSMIKKRKGAPTRDLEKTPTQGDREPHTMVSTADQATTEVNLPPEIAAMGLDAHKLFERVRMRLDLQDTPVFIDRYELRAQIGQGGMGVVYLAWDPQLGREIAVKIVRASPLVNAAKLRARLLREARLLAQLQHRHVVRVYDVGDHAGEVFVTMEYIRGASLKDWQALAQWTIPDLLRVYIEAGHGLAAAHEHGIVHRDFKPENVFVDHTDHAVVGDFGLAHALGSELGLAEPINPEQTAKVPLPYDTQTGEFLGTLAYMAPEQLQGQVADVRSDQYAYCVALWEALCGERPFRGSTCGELLAAMNRPPTGGETTPRWLRTILCVGLAVDPGHRHADMKTLVARLERGLGRRKRWLMGSTLLLAGILGLGGAIVLINHNRTSCEVARDLAALRDTASTQSELDTALVGRLQGDLRQLEHEARKACSESDTPTLQYLERWRAGIATVMVDSTPDDDDLRRLLQWLDHARYDHPPPSPISTEVFEALIRANAAEYDDRFGDAIAAAEDALSLAESDVDRTEAHLQLGRARSLAGDYPGALEDYDAALLASLRCGFVDAQLRARLLAVRTQVMRLEQIDEGQVGLREAEAQLEFLREPLLSSRRADALELKAAIERRRGAIDSSAQIQAFAVRSALLSGRDEDLASALTNYGNVEYAYRDAPVRAELAYRLALVVIPDFPDALINLVHLINERERELDEAEFAFLDQALALLAELEGQDLKIRTLTEVLKLSIRRAEDQQVRADERALEQALERGTDTNLGMSPTTVAKAWLWISIARASRGELDMSYDRALRGWLEAEPKTDPLQRLEWMLVAVSLATESSPEPARRLLERIMSELHSLSASDRRRELLESGEALRAELSVPSQPSPTVNGEKQP